MTAEDWVIGTVGAVSWVLILLLLVVTVVLFVRQIRASASDNAHVETEFAETLAWVRSLAAGRHRDSVVVAHRARELPWLFRWAARRGAAPVPAGYGPPPPLTDAPDPRSWEALNLNPPARVLTPAVGHAPVVREDRWEEIDVKRDVLAGRMEAAADTEQTGLLPPVPASGGVPW